MKLRGIFHIYVKIYSKDKLTLKKCFPQILIEGIIDMKVQSFMWIISCIYDILSKSHGKIHKHYEFQVKTFWCWEGVELFFPLMKLPKLMIARDLCSSTMHQIQWVMLTLL